MISFILNLKRLIDKFNRDEMTVYAAQASFFIVLSAFPFLMLLLTLVQVIPAVSRTDIQRAALEMIPDVLEMDSLVSSIIDNVYTNSPGTILSVTAVTALWSASRGMISMKRGLNRVLDIRDRSSYLLERLICAGYTVVFVLVCIFSLVLLVFGTTIQHIVLRFFPFLSAVTDYIISFRSLFALTLLTLCFTGMYTLVPKKKQPPRSQLPGAVFSTVCWILFSYAFSIYFNHFHNFSYMYGSLTAIVLLMLWLYFGICILFFGAEINYFLRERSRAALSSCADTPDNKQD